jgi:WD40 repeat protein
MLKPNLLKILFYFTISYYVSNCTGPAGLDLLSLQPARKIVYIRNNNTLYMYDTNTQTSSPVFTHNDTLANPVWSPDKNQIIYYRAAGISDDIFLYDTESKALKNLDIQASYSWDTRPVWLDCNCIILADEGGINKYFIAQDSIVRLIRQDGIIDFQTGPGNRVVYCTRDTIYSNENIFSPENKHGKKFAMNEIMDIALSPGGNLAAVCHADNIERINLINGRVETIYKDKDKIYWLDWTSDTSLVFLEGKPARQYGFDSRKFDYDNHSGGYRQIGHDYRVKTYGHFSIKHMTVNSGNTEISTLYKNMGNVFSVQPAMSGDRQLLTFIANDRNVKRKVMLISVQNGRLAKVSDEGGCSHPGFVE